MKRSSVQQKFKRREATPPSEGTSQNTVGLAGGINPPGQSAVPSPAVLSGGADSLQDARERILYVILYAALIAGVFALLATLPERIRSGNWLVVGAFIGAYALIAAMAFFKRLPYRLRAISLVVVIILLGLSTMVTDGLYGSGRLYFLLAPVIASILVGPVAGLVTLLVDLLFLLGVGWAFLNGQIAVPQVKVATDNASLSAWVIAGTAFLLIGITATLPLLFTFRGLQNSILREKLLRDDLDAERAQLEERISQRTKDLERRLIQIRTAAEISRSISSLLEPEELLQRVVNLVHERFDLYYVGAFLLNESGDMAELRAATGEAGEKMIAAAHRLSVPPLYSAEAPHPLYPAPAVGAVPSGLYPAPQYPAAPYSAHTSMIGWCIANRKPRIALDVGREAVRFENPDLPLTRSELALPLLVGASGDTTSDSFGRSESAARCLGALSIQSDQAMAFDDDDVAILQGFADSLATALENAGLFQMVRKNLEDIRALNRQYMAQSWAQVIEQQGKLSYSTSGEIGGGGDDESVDIPLLLRNEKLGKVKLEFGRALGVSAISDEVFGAADILKPEDMAFIESVATEAALAMENVRLLEETQRRIGYERLLANISLNARSSTDLDTVLRETVAELGRVLNASEGIIRLDMAALETSVETHELYSAAPYSAQASGGDVEDKA